MNKPVDFLGRTILPGDLIVYPWRRGSRMGLHKLSVTQVTDSSVTGFNNIGHRITIKNLNNIVVDMISHGRSAAEV